MDELVRVILYSRVYLDLSFECSQENVLSFSENQCVHRDKSMGLIGITDIN